MTDPSYVPDPQLVRELAREAIGIAAVHCRDASVNGVIFAHEWPKVVDGTYLMLRNAITAEYDKANIAVTWPDEISPAELDVTLDGLIDAAHRRRPGFDDDVRAVADLLQASKRIGEYWAVMDEDVQAELMTWLLRASDGVRSRFADRIAELEQRDTVAANLTEA